MAVSVSIELVQKTNITVRISGLQYSASNYNFQFQLTRTATTEYTTKEFDGTSTSDTYQDYNFSGLLPNNGYNVTVFVRYPKDTGSWYQYTYGSNPVTTNNIVLPSGEYYPTYYPMIQSQSVYIDNDYKWEAGCCVPCACATAMNISEYRERGTTNNNYSIAYIYGNRRLQPNLDSEGAGMYTQKTLEQLQTDGSPQWDIIPINNTKRYPDCRYYDDNYVYEGGTANEVGAETLYTTYEPSLQTQARLQKIGSISNVSFYDCETIATYIQNNGFAIMDFAIPENFDGGNYITPDPSASSSTINEFELNNYVVAEPSRSATSTGGHSMCLIGWKDITGIKCWIAQNSWTSDWGDNGYCYIPMDWGMDSEYPDGTFGTGNGWVRAIFTFTGVTTTIPRPSDFAWTNAKVSGQTFDLTADEWDAFTAKINEFRIYKGLSAYLFKRAVPAQQFTAIMFNESINKLNDLSSYFTEGKTIPTTKNKYDPIMASYFNDMRDALNSIT